MKYIQCICNSIEQASQCHLKCNSEFSSDIKEIPMSNEVYGECGKHPGYNMVNCAICKMEQMESQHLIHPTKEGIEYMRSVGNELEESEESKAFVAKHVEKVFQLLKDSYIEQHIKPMFDSLSAASIQHFLDTGTINGGFYEALNKLMDNARNFGGNRDEIERLTLERDLAQGRNKELVKLAVELKEAVLKKIITVNTGDPVGMRLYNAIHNLNKNL